LNTLEQLNKHMPDDLKFTKKDLPLSKNVVKKKLHEYAKRYPDMYSKNIHKIGTLGEELAYVHGHHIGIDDLLPTNRKQIKNYINKESNKLKLMNDEQKKEHLLKTFNGVKDLTMQIENNHLVDQGKSRGRGNPDTITRTIGAPIYTVDMNSEPFPFMLKNSIAEGYRAHELYASGSQARYAAVSAATSTSEPGAMGKVLVANTEHLKICCHDCGTRNGVSYNIDDPEVIGRYEARTNHLVTKEYVTKLKKEKKKKIVLRDPTTCEGKDGVCQLCYGHNALGKQLEIGNNVGITAAQTVSEKATQLVLSAKHNIGGKLKSVVPTGFLAQKVILNTPENYQGKAVLSTTDGKIDKIESLPTGGHNVYIANKKHYVPSEINLTVKAGQSVDRGQQISTGLASTRDIVAHRGILEARKHVVDELFKANSGDIDKKQFGVIARGYVDLVKKKGDDNHSLYNYDSTASQMELPNTTKIKTNNIQAVNKFLAKPTLHYSIGSKITNHMIKDFKENNIDEIDVAHNPAGLEPVYKTYEQKPLVSSPLWQSLNYRGIKKGIGNELLYNEGTDTKKLKSDRAKYTLGVL